MTVSNELMLAILSLVTQHYTMLARNLLYTAVTRGKRLVVLVGQRRALATAVRSASGRKRRTKLKEWWAR
jgi:exodeoxyribonuclease V alpha subunit